MGAFVPAIWKASGKKFSDGVGSAHSPGGRSKYVRLAGRHSDDLIAQNRAHSNRPLILASKYDSCFHQVVAE